MPDKVYKQKYRKIREIGQGAYGKINLAEIIDINDLGNLEEEIEPAETTNAGPEKKGTQIENELKPASSSSERRKYVALKKLMLDVDKSLNEANSGIHFTSIREIKILKEIHHPNIVKLRDVFVENGNIYLAMECLSCDLAKLIDDPKVVMKEGDVAEIFHQILKGVQNLHENWVLHRDLKPGNILVDLDGVCKITDFGLARNYGEPERELTKGIATRWYRPPEILYGASFYGEAVDIWACGCILAELYLRKPFFKGDGDIEQLSKIFGIRGTPTVDLVDIGIWLAQCAVPALLL